VPQGILTGTVISTGRLEGHERSTCGNILIVLKTISDMFRNKLIGFDIFISALETPPLF
jgi:hypothetical protein